MFRIISAKSIFAFLTITLILIFIGNYFLKTNAILEQKIIANETRSKKIMGARIYKENEKGEKYLIIAESLNESETEDKKVELENSITTINKNGVITNISAGFAIISNNYEDFDLSKKVEITKKARNFILKTNSLIGTLKKGNFFTNDKVDIVSGNIRINGEGLDLKRNGEYIKIKGKAKLVMVLSTKNEN
jgi:LPS export ABC transporter protein LptC